MSTQGLHGIQKLFNLDFQMGEFSSLFSLKLIETRAESRDFYSHFMEWVSNSNVKLITSLASPGGEVAPFTKFYTGRLCHEVQPTALLDTFFFTGKAPLRILFIKKSTPLTNQFLTISLNAYSKPLKYKINGPLVYKSQI